MEFFYVVKATQKSGKDDAVIWFTAKSEARANLQLDVKLEDAGIETGRGKDYAKPVRTDFPVYNDLPEESAVDYTWCKRYELQGDGRTWLPKASAESMATNDAPGNTTPKTNIEDPNKFEIVQVENRNPAVRFAIHLTLERYQTHVTKEQHIAATEISLDEGNVYLQKLLLAKNDVPETAKLSLNAEWKMIQAVKEIFAPDEEHEAEVIAAFMADWAKADAGDRKQLVEDWRSGKFPLLKSESTSNAGVATGQDLAADNGIKIDENDDETTLYPVVRMPFRKQLLAQFTADELRHHVSRDEFESISALEMDTDNSYAQNLLLAAENCEEVKGYDTKDLWRYTDAIRKVFCQEKRHELALVLRFTRIWAATDYIDRGTLAREWADGNRISKVGTPVPLEPEQPETTESYKRAVAQNMANLSIEIAIAQLYPEAVPGKINRAQLLAAKELADKKDESHAKALKVLGKTTDILDYDASSIFGVTRAISWSGEESTTELRSQVREWFTANGIYESGERSKGYPEWDEDSRAVRHSTVEEPSNSLQPQIASLGGGVFSIEGLMGTQNNDGQDIKTHSNEVEKEENQPGETTSNEQMEATDGNEIAGSAEVSAGESADAACEEAVAVTAAEILAANAPSLSNATQPEPATPEEVVSALDEQCAAPAAEFPAYFELGRYEGLPNDAYHASNGISSTQVKDARISLMYFHGRHITKTIGRETSDALTFGTLMHSLALEPEAFDDEFAVFPGVPAGAFTSTDTLKAFIRDYNADKAKADQLKLTGKKEELQEAIRAVNPEAIFADEFEQQWREANQHKIILSAQQLAHAKAIQQALFSHPSAGQLLQHPNRANEVSYFGMDEETGLEVRVRPDLEIDMSGVRIGVDLKTISLGKVKQDYLRAKLHREIIERDYHLSAAMYCDVADFNQFFWIFVNKDEGYHWVAIIEASEELLELGRLEYRKAINAISNALDTNVWPAPITADYTDELNDFDMRRLEALRLA